MSDRDRVRDLAPDDDPPRAEPEQRSVIDNTRWALAGGIAIAGVALAIGLASGPSRPPPSPGSGTFIGPSRAQVEAEERHRLTAHQALAELVDSTDDAPPAQLL